MERRANESEDAQRPGGTKESLVSETKVTSHQQAAISAAVTERRKVEEKGAQAEKESESRRDGGMEGWLS